MRALSVLCVASVSALKHEHTEQTLQMALHTSEKWRSDCGQKIHKFSMAQVQNPGAGMDPDSIKPFEKVLKDGFFLVACVKDAMYEAGDAFGNNKVGYKMGPVSNSSIVHYTEHVKKEDREDMTHGVCFEFCRGVPDMGYFGINNGRDCYCTPYFKAMASDSSECDSVCDGENTQMCGGKTKNSIFGMHTCADTESDLATATEDGTEAKKNLKGMASAVKDEATDAEADAGSFQTAFGGAGDPTASGLMQAAKAFAGECIHAADDALEIVTALEGALADVKGMEGKDFTNYENAKKAEAAIKATQGLTSKAEEEGESLAKIAAEATPQHDQDHVKGADKQYYPIMYFVDKEFEDSPTTCGGDLAASPIFGNTIDECAASCDNLVNQCVGFGYFQKESSLCFLYSKFTEAQYWTGCKGSAFLQKGGDVVQCKAKLSEFEGVSLKPKGGGKCDFCLKELTKADRCW